MTTPRQGKRKLYKRLLGVVGVLLLFLFAAHPELRILVPFFDAVGLDVLGVLLGTQVLALFASTFRPVLFAAWKRLVPWLSLADRAMASGGALAAVRGMAGRLLGECSGVLGQYLDACCAQSWRLACSGPGHAPVPGSPGGPT